MRASHLATALTAFAAGLSAATVLHRRAERVQPPAASATPAPAPIELPAPEVPGVVLPFLRSVTAAAAPATPARCGDNGGLTKAGSPCAARATGGGRCHHHRLAA